MLYLLLWSLVRERERRVYYSLRNLWFPQDFCLWVWNALTTDNSDSALCQGRGLFLLGVRILFYKESCDGLRSGVLTSIATPCFAVWWIMQMRQRDGYERKLRLPDKSVNQTWIKFSMHMLLPGMTSILELYELEQLAKYDPEDVCCAILTSPQAIKYSFPHNKKSSPRRSPCDKNTHIYVDILPPSPVEIFPQVPIPAEITRGTPGVGSEVMLCNQVIKDCCSLKCGFR